MRRSLPSAALFALWLVWTVWVVAHAFTIPARWLVPLDGAIAPPLFWREALFRAAIAIAGASIVALAAWSAGEIVTRGRLSSLFTHQTERVSFQLGLGFGAISVLLTALAFLHLYRPAVVAPVLAIVASRAVWMAATRRGPGMWWPRALRRRPGPATIAFFVCACAAVGCALLAALAPETEFDALWYHLWLPHLWLQAGHPVDIVDEYIALYPLTWETLYGAAMVLGGPVAAKLLHFVCLPLVGLTSWMLTRRLFPRADAMLAAALTVAAPTLLWESTTAYVDLALAWYIALAVYALLRYAAARERGWLVIAALTMGVALGIKHLALVALAVLTVALVVRELRVLSPGRALRSAVVFVTIAMAVPLPWYARAAVASGNPVFPEMYRVFGAKPSSRWTPDSERELQAFKDHFGRPRTLSNLVTLPWDMAVHADRYGGTLGPLFLIFVPFALFGHRGRNLAAWSVAGGVAAYVAFWVSPLGSLQLRFLVPLVPLLAALASEGAARIEGAGASIVRGAGSLVAAAVVLLLVLNLPPVTAWQETDRSGWTGWQTHVTRGLPLAVVAGIESEQDYLSRRVPAYRAWQFIDGRLAAGSRVLSFSGGDNLYERTWRLDSAAPVTRTLWTARLDDEERVLAAVQALQVTHVLIDRRQIADGKLRRFALAGDRLRACCLVLEYEDERFDLYAIHPPETARR